MQCNKKWCTVQKRLYFYDDNDCTDCPCIRWMHLDAAWSEEPVDENHGHNMSLPTLQQRGSGNGCSWMAVNEYEYTSRVRELTAPMHLGVEAGPLCPMSNQGGPEALLNLQMAPRLIIWVSLGSKKRSPDMHVWVRPKPHIHKEYGPRFPQSPHISYTMDCPAVLVGRDAASGCYDQ